MPRRSTYKPFQEGASPTTACEAVGCAHPGVHRCPRSPKTLNEFLFLCTEHAREHNQKWNYFEGFSDEDFERYYQESRIGHRPTWKFGVAPGAAEAELKAAMERFLNARGGNVKRSLPQELNLTPQERKAMRLLGFDTLPTIPALKQRYKELAKQYHPDVNKGATASEERLKEVNLAYSVLKKRVQSS